jgi:uncharacterized protein YodC (DUF2158 family)
LNLTASASGGSSPICYNTSPGTFTATSTGGAGIISYQWYNGATAIGGATANTYAPGSLTATTTYHCAVTRGICGPVNSNNITITVDGNVVATVSGGTSPICYNTAPGTFTVTTTGGAGSYTYQWYNGAGSISGATASTYAPGNLTASDAYTCSVTNASCGTVASNTASISVDANLTAAISGGTSPVCYNTAPDTFTATGSGGTGSYTYQWYNSSGSISGATASTYAPGNLIAFNTYNCSVTSGSCGTAASDTISITVYATFTATISGGTSPVCYNTSPGVFTALGNGGIGSYTYQWYNSPGSISGATSSTFDPGSLTASNSYSCAVTDISGCGTVNTSTTPISVYANLTAGVSGGTSPVCYNTSPGTFTASGSGGTGTYTYQWYNSSASISGATASTYAPGNVTAPTGYYCAISSGSCGIVNTSTTSIAVDGAVTAVVTSGTTLVCYNTSPGTFTATGSGGGGSYSYQWYNGAGSISGATASTYNPGGITISDSYHCDITDATCGTASSNVIDISVNAATSATASNGGPYVVGQTISLSSSSSGATGYSWSGPLGFTSGLQNPGISGATTGMTGTYTVTATDASGCIATASTDVSVTTTAAYTWTGTTGTTSWTTPANWSPTAPVGGPNSCAIDVIIPNVTISPVITSAIQVGNVQIDAGAQITLSAANISVCKNWVGASGANAVITGTGIVVFNGSTAQSITGSTQMQELMLSNTAGASLLSGSALDIYTALDLASGNFDASNGTLTFKSRTVDSVGIIDNFSSGYAGTLTGSITAERYYATSLTLNQHFMGSPVNTPSMTQFGASGTPGNIIDLTCDETQSSSNSPYGTVFALEESAGATCGLDQWKVVISGSAENGLGYSLLKPGTGTLVLNGTANLNSGYSLSGLLNSNWSNTTLQTHTETSGWQLVSNPYLATLNISTASSGMDGQVQVWNANGGFAGSYQPGIIGTDATIAPFQAFMVHKTTTVGSATFTMNATDRVRAPHIFFAQNANQLNIVAANVATGLLDQTTVGFNPAATDTFDVQLDAAKFPGALNRHTLYTVNNNKWMSRNVLHDEATTSTVPMGFEPGKNGTYKLTFNGLNSFDPTSYIYLEDKALNVMYNVRNGDYTFTADSADNWNRFVLHFTPPAVVTTADASCNAAGTITIQQPGTANWNYTLTTSGNAIITSGTLNQSQQVTVEVAAGTYTLTLIDTNSYTVAKTITVNGPEMITAAFQESSDVVQTGQSVTLTSTTSGVSTYQWSFGNGTSANGATTSVSYTQAGVYEVSLVVTSPSGCSSTKTESITVNTTTTGLNNLSGTGSLRIWSHDDKVYVDFTGVTMVNSLVTIYNILGQQIVSENVISGNLIFQQKIDTFDAEYLIVMVRNDDKIVTKKVLITNGK